jgi:DnaJ domain
MQGTLIWGNSHEWCRPTRLLRPLGVDPKADLAGIKAAYRCRAKELHPDRNPSPRTKEEFQLLVVAYETLGNAEKRAEYDTLASASTVDRATKCTHESTEVTEPIQCSSCGTVTEQPRHIILWTVMSFLLVTIRKPTQGVFCHYCAGDKAIKASVLTWLLGWWGIPWGPIWSIYYLLKNLLGGDKSSDANAALLGRHALAFAQDVCTGHRCSPASILVCQQFKHTNIP